MTIQPASIQPATIDPATIRPDFRLIADLIEPGRRVIDVGCGDGTLLAHLAQTKQIDGHGIELKRKHVAKALAHGLSVIQGDAESELSDYPAGTFDYAVLSQTLQAMRAPQDMLNQLLRIAGRAVVSFPNFGHWQVRLHLALKGTMPKTRFIQYEWHDTPNIHLCTIKDFVNLTRKMEIRIEGSAMLSGGAKADLFRSPTGFANLFAEQAIFILSRE